jgi:hypothetical protein
MTMTIAQISQYAEVIRAVQEHRRVRYLDREDTLIEGTFRHFSPSEGNGAHAHGDANPDSVWVRITTSAGFETWVLLRELVLARLDGRLAW